MSEFWTTFSSPVGKLTLRADDRGLQAILWEQERLAFDPTEPLTEAPDHPLLLKARKQLQAYFSLSRKDFSLPLDLRGTPFQTRVWQALLTIPYGETASYAEIARRIARPSAVRAVGAAIGRNPIPLFIPCHRVIGSRGELTGFAGGIAIKRFLLEHEKANRFLFAPLT